MTRRIPVGEDNPQDEIDYCCEYMRYQVEASCPVHVGDCPDIIMRRYDTDCQGVWYGIPIRDGGSSCIKIKFCPWCGENPK